MNVRFIGGPYDGLELSAFDVQRCLHLISFRSDRRLQHFVYMPAVEDWPAVLAGTMAVHRSTTYHYYEMFSTATGVEFRCEQTDRGIWRAITELVRSQKDGRPPGASEDGKAERDGQGSIDRDGHDSSGRGW